MMATEKNRIAGPFDQTVPCFNFGGIAFPIIADLPEGGFVQIVNGPSALGQAVPSVQLAKGAMLAVITADVAGQIRAELRKAQAQQALQGKPN